MKKKSALLWIALAAILILEPACSIAGQSVAEPTQTLSLTETSQVLSPTNTIAPIADTPTGIPPTAAQAPTEMVPTLTAIKTPRAVPQAPLNADGPWLLISAENGLWAINPDGSGLKWMTDEKNISLRKSLSPDGKKLAFVTLMVPTEMIGLELFVIDLPSGEFNHIATLSPKNQTEAAEPGDRNFEAIRAIYDYSPPVWSPDGTQLAFIGAQDGPSSDLYVYILATGEIKRLTDGPSQGYQPNWSPDGQWVVHTGAESFGTGAGYLMSGIWAAKADGTEVKSLYPVKDSADEVLDGWVSEDTFLVNSWNMVCGANNLRSVSISSKEVRTLWAGGFDEHNFAWDPSSGNLLISVRGDSECSGGNPGGIYWISGEGGTPERIAEDGRLSWSANANLFIVREKNSLEFYSPEGKMATTIEGSGRTPVAAPGGALWAFYNEDTSGEQGAWVGGLNENPRKIFNQRVRYIAWSPDGKNLFLFASDNSIYVATAPDFIPALAGQGVNMIGEPVWSSTQ